MSELVLPHPSSAPSSRVRREKRHACEEAILGGAREAAERYLERASDPEGEVGAPLARRVRDHVYDHRNRKKYVAAATGYLREKRPSLSESYDVVLVGAGIHAAMFIYVARKAHPHLSVLIVEKSTEICSTFSRMGDSLILNSPTSSKVGLNSNVAQGHFVQVSDFDELAERPFPTAKHLHELATMVLFHADADIVFDFCVDDVRRAGGNYAVSSNGRIVEARSIIVSNGMGEPRRDAFVSDKSSARVIPGDDFIAAHHEDEAFSKRMVGKTLAVVGAGDTANCVMECLLPLTYPRCRYGASRNDSFAPALVYWIGQGARNVRDFYFVNKQRYCHSGGVIEFFWDGESPFDLPAEAWKRAKSRIRCVSHKLLSLSHEADSIELRAGSERFEVDLVVDCTGRCNELSLALLRDEYEFVEGDVVFRGGQWDERMEQFIDSPRFLHAKRIACRIKGERIFLIGTACPLDELIGDEEAMDGSLRYQEHRTSLTNSKWSLEHTLPRSVAFAEQCAGLLRLDTATRVTGESDDGSLGRR